MGSIFARHAGRGWQLGAVLALQFLCPHPSFATHSGILIQQHSGLALRTDSGDLPIEVESAAKPQLAALAAGDYATLFGVPIDLDGNGRPDLLQVSGVGTVGIRRILGQWSSSQQSSFSFQSHSRLIGAQPNAILKLRYSLTPKSRSVFSILMIDDSKAATATRPKGLLVTLADWLRSLGGQPEASSDIQVGQLVFNDANSVTLELFTPSQASNSDRLAIQLKHTGRP